MSKNSRCFSFHNRDKLVSPYKWMWSSGVIIDAFNMDKFIETYFVKLWEKNVYIEKIVFSE